MWCILGLLLVFGAVAVYTASSYQKGGPLKFLAVQLVAALIGLAAAFAVSRINYSLFSRRGFIIAASAVAVLASAAVFFFPEINGSRRWIYIGGLSVQPSEFSRVVLVFALAARYSRIGASSRNFTKGVLYPSLILFAFVAPVLFSPDIGASAVMVLAAGTVFLAAGVRRRWIFLGAFIAIAALSVFILANPNKRSRVKTFIDSRNGVESTSETSYHTAQSKEAFARGGIFGVGVGNSLQKHRYLPEANSDFIYAIIAEEFGILGTGGLALVFLSILFCGVYIAYHAPDRFGRYTALALTVMLTGEAAINMAMVSGCIPTKGMALPFTSAGGSSLIASTVIIGYLVSVADSAHEHMLSRRYEIPEVF